MPNIDKERILNQPKKRLISEYNKLKEKYSRKDASKYKSLYENESLSFILENSEYIFTEPAYGLNFYKNIIENVAMPFSNFISECGKVNLYVDENVNSMNPNQKALYKELKEFMKSKYKSRANTCCMYDVFIESSDSVMPYYDALYEYSLTESDFSKFKIEDMFNCADSNNIFDVMNIALECTDFHPELVAYLESMYVEDPQDSSDYALNSFTANSIKRMLKDDYIKEKVDEIRNINLYHTIIGLAGVDSSDYFKEVTNTTIEKPDYRHAYGSSFINGIFDDAMIIDEACKDEDVEKDKLHNMMCEKALIDVEASFLLVDSQVSESSYIENQLVDSVILESSTVYEEAPKTVEEEIETLYNRSQFLESSMREVTEAFFTKDGRPSKVVADSLGAHGLDSDDPRLAGQKQASVATDTGLHGGFEEYHKTDHKHDDKDAEIHRMKSKTTSVDDGKGDRYLSRELQDKEDEKDSEDDEVINHHEIVPKKKENKHIVTDIDDEDDDDEDEPEEDDVEESTGMSLYESDEDDEDKNYEKSAFNISDEINTRYQNDKEKRNFLQRAFDKTPEPEVPQKGNIFTLEMYKLKRKLLELKELHKMQEMQVKRLLKFQLI